MRTFLNMTAILLVFFSGYIAGLHRAMCDAFGSNESSAWYWNIQGTWWYVGMVGTIVLAIIFYFISRAYKPASPTIHENPLREFRESGSTK